MLAFTLQKPIFISPFHDPSRCPDHSPCSDLVVSVVSPILANSQVLHEPPSRSVTLVQSPKRDCIVVQCSPHGPRAPALDAGCGAAPLARQPLGSHCITAWR